jgi:hypothetical protein
VVDTTPPVIDAHATVTVQATNAHGAAVVYASPATLDAVSGAGLAVCAPASGSTFAVGTTAVSCTASDAAGNSSASSFAVTVTPKNDKPPKVKVPHRVVEEATGPGGAAVTFEASASDKFDGPLPVSCSAVSGAVFPIGTTAVTCSATDSTGHTSTASIEVIVTVKKK